MQPTSDAAAPGHDGYFLTPLGWFLIALLAAGALLVILRLQRKRLSKTKTP